MSLCPKEGGPRKSLTTRIRTSRFGTYYIEQMYILYSVWLLSHWMPLGLVNKARRTSRRRRRWPVRYRSRGTWTASSDIHDGERCLIALFLNAYLTGPQYLILRDSITTDDRLQAI